MPVQKLGEKFEGFDMTHHMLSLIHILTADEAASRISDTSTRPLFQNLEAARARCEERLPLYEAVADVRVSTAGKSVPAIAREVQRILEKEGILCPQQR